MLRSLKGKRAPSIGTLEDIVLEEEEISPDEVRFFVDRGEMSVLAERRSEM